jgi:3D (Asp-Asp-Asp) domain-containing protein
MKKLSEITFIASLLIGAFFLGRSSGDQVQLLRRKIAGMSLNNQPRFLFARRSGDSAAVATDNLSEGSAFVGAHPPALAGPSVYIVTAFCPCSRCCGKWADGVTASGHVIQPGDKFCAADPSIPFGTMLDIPGYGIVPVLDRGGAIKGNKLDVYFDTHARALRWGRSRLIVKGVLQ